MSRQLLILGVFLAVMVAVNGEFAVTSTSERLSWNPNRTAIVDRTVDCHRSPGFFTLGLDRTSFSVDRAVWLQQFDIVKVYGYDPNAEIPVRRIPIRIKIRKIPQDDSQEADKIETVFTGHTVVNSTHEATVNVFSKVLLQPGFVYEIRLKMPDHEHFMYTDCLDIHEHKITRFFSKSILVQFQQGNPSVRPHSLGQTHRKVSRGMVKRLHLKYSWF